MKNFNRKGTTMVEIVQLLMGVFAVGFFGLKIYFFLLHNLDWPLALAIIIAIIAIVPIFFFVLYAYPFDCYCR